MSTGRCLRAVVAAVLVLLTVLLTGLTGPVAHAAEPAGAWRPVAGGSDTGDGRRAPGRLMLISVPALSWSDVDERSTPAIWSLVAGASVALLSTRTADEVDTASSAYLTLGAGRRAGSTGGPASGAAQQGPDGIVALGFDEQVRRNLELDYDAQPGSLGETLGNAGVVVGVVGDAALALDDPHGRSVTLGSADRSGRTPVGRVEELLVEDPAAPGAVWLDEGAVIDAVGQELERSEVVLVEASDLDRAVRSGRDASIGLRRTDELVGQLVTLLDPGVDDVLLVSPTSTTELREPGVFVWRGPGVGAGLATSPTTRRPGYVALTDTAATVLRIVGVPVPAGVGDTPVAPSVGSTSGSVTDRVARLADATVRATDRDRTVGPVAVTLVLLAVVCGLAGLVALWRHRGLPGWAVWLGATTIASPGAAFTVGIWPGVGVGVVGVVAWMLLVAGIVGALGLRWGTEGRAAPLLPATFTSSVLVLDVLSGGWLQIDTPLGYSASVAGRFAGLGNQASSYLLAATLAIVASGWVLLSGRGWSRRALVSVATGVGIAVVAVIGAPWWGSDVGGVLTALPAFAVVVALSASGGRFGIRVFLGAAAALVSAAVVLLLVGLWDRSRAVSERTHLGRFVDDLFDGSAVTVLQRKVAAAWEVTTSTPWAVAVPILLVGLLSLAWMPGGRRWAVCSRRQELAAFGGAIAVAGFTGWVVNDSGVGVPAAMLVIAVPYVACLAPGGRRPPEVPDGGPLLATAGGSSGVDGPGSRPGGTAP